MPIQTQLQAQGEKLKRRSVRLEEELASTREASAKGLEDASSQMEGLRTLNKSVRGSPTLHYLQQRYVPAATAALVASVW